MHQCLIVISIVMSYSAMDHEEPIAHMLTIRTANAQENNSNFDNFMLVIFTSDNRAVKSRVLHISLREGRSLAGKLCRTLLAIYESCFALLILIRLKIMRDFSFHITEAQLMSTDMEMADDAAWLCTCSLHNIKVHSYQRYSSVYLSILIPT